MSSDHLPGAGARESDVDSMDAYRKNYNAIGNAIESSPGDIDTLRQAMEGSGQALAEGGKQAGQSIQDGSSAAAKLLAGVGTSIGRNAAAAFNANARVPVGGGRQLATGNMGVSMPNAGETRPFGGDKS